MAKSKTVQTSVEKATNPPVIKVRDLSWPLRTLIALAGVGGAIIILYFIIIVIYATYAAIA